MWHDIGIGVGQRRGLQGGSPLSISAPGVLYFLTASQPVTTVTGDKIVFADRDDDGSGEYDITITLTNSGTFDLATIVGLANLTGNGTASVAFRGTIAESNAACDQYAYNDFLTGAGTITVTMERVSDTLQ